VFFTVFYTVFFNRQFRVAISADIESFYHRIGVPQHYQTLQRFVFRPSGSQDPLSTFQMTTLVFGAEQASIAAIWVLRHAIRQDQQCSTISETIHEDYFSDNLSKSLETEEDIFPRFKNLSWLSRF
jgi:hypothetical protein